MEKDDLTVYSTCMPSDFFAEKYAQKRLRP